MEETKSSGGSGAAEGPTAAAMPPSGFATLSLGSHVLVRHEWPAGGFVWKAGAVAEWNDGYTIMYADGTHDVLRAGTVFTVQRATPAAGKLAPGSSVLAPVSVESTSVFFSGIVTELDGDTANVVFGQHGSQWVWVKDAAEPGVEVMHYLGFRATLQPQEAARPVPINMLCAGADWLRFESLGGPAVRLAREVLHKPESITMRMDVPDSQSPVGLTSPLLTADAVLRAAATMFDADHDGGLSVAEYNTFTAAACGPVATQDYAPDKAAEIPKEVKRWIIKRPDLVRLAASVGYVVNPGDPIPLDAMPGIWKAHAAARAARLHDVSDQDRLLLELGNVLLVRYGRGMPAAQTVTLLDAHPPEIKNEAMNNFLAALPKLYISAGAVSGIAASAAAVSMAKASCLWDTEAPKELMESLSAALQAAIVKAPHVVNAFMEAMVGAWTSAPETMAAFKGQALEAVAGARLALEQLGFAAQAALLASSQLAAQFVVAAEEAIRNGAPIATGVITRVRGFFASGGAKPAPQEGGGGLGDALGDIGALLTAAIAEMRNFCGHDTLAELQDVAGTVAAALGNLPSVQEIAGTMHTAATEAVAAMASVDVDKAAVLAAASGAAEAAREAAAAAAEAGESTAAALGEAAAVAASAVPGAVALTTAAATEMDRVFRIAAARGAALSGPAVEAIMLTLRTGQDAIAGVAGDVQATLASAATKVTPALLASAMAAVGRAAGAIPSVASLRDVFTVAVAECGAAVALLADSEAVGLLGGAGEAGKVVAAGVVSAMGEAAEAGADVSAAAAAQLTAAANNSAAALAVASAEAKAAAMQAAANAANAAADATQATKDAANLAWKVAAAGAASARAAAATTRRQGLEALQAAGAAVEGLDAQVLQAQLVEASEAAAAAVSRRAVTAAIAAGEGAGRVLRSAQAIAIVAANASAAAWADMASSEAVAAAAQGASAAASAAVEATRAGAEAAMAAAEPAVSAAARAAVSAAAEARAAVTPGVKAGAAIAAAAARGLAECAQYGAEAAAAGVSDGVRAAIEVLPDDAASRMHTLLAAGVNAGAVVLKHAAATANEAADAAMQAGRALSPLIPQLLSVGKVAASAAATGAAVAAGTIADAAGDVADALSPAAREAAQFLGNAGSTAADLAAAGITAGGAAALSAGTAVAGLAGQGFEEAKQAAGAVAGLAVAAGTKFWDSALATGQDLVSWETVGDVYTMSSEAIMNLTIAAVAVAGSCAACASRNCPGIDAIKISIVRDFFQMIGLFFASMASKAMELASGLWGNLSNLISFDLNFVFPSINPIVIYVIIGIIAFILLICFVVFMCMASSTQPDAVREGHEAKLWDEQAEKNKKTVKFLRWFLYGCFSVYLPVSRTVFQILVCEATMGRALELLGLNLGCTLIDSNLDSKSYECNCSDWEPYVYLQIGAVLLLLLFTLLLPIKCYQLIKANVPVGSREDPSKRYDEDGQLVDYTDHMYNMDLMTDPAQLKCPYLFLYKGYERKWAYYQVLVMLFKFLLCIPVVVFWNRILIQTLVTLLLLTIYCAFSFYSTPFLSAQADGMDASARLTTVATVLFGLLGSDDVFPSAGSPFAILIHIVNFINIVAILVFTAYGFPSCRRRIQNTVGKFQFRDTCINELGPARKIVPGWDLQRETKHRVWHSFWNSVIVNTCSDEVTERFANLKKRVADVGKRRVVDHFRALEVNPRRSEQRQWVMDNLEGVDVYFDGVPLDGHLDSKTKFCKMYINPFPFEVVLAYDDSDDVNFLFEGDFDKFVAQNTNPDVLQRRHNRRVCRGLELSEAYVVNPFTRMETHTVPDGQEHYTDSEGRSHTRQRYTAVQVLMSYTQGQMHVKTTGSSAYARGFSASLHYADGHGTAIAPHTGQSHHVTNSYTMPAHEFGLDNTFRTSPKWGGIMSTNLAKVQEGLSRLAVQDRNYRNGLREKREQAEGIMSSDFWYFVYDNEAAMYDRARLEEYFVEYGQRQFNDSRVLKFREEIASIPTAHKAGLDFLYGRLKWIHSHPCSQLWWVFFDDLWQENRELKVMTAKEEVQKLFDTRSSDSIAYHPLPRAKFEAKMEELGLRNVGGCRGTSKYFNDSVLDSLYNRMDELDEYVRLGTANLA